MAVALRLPDPSEIEEITNLFALFYSTRGVAQLVARYVRDVEAARSSRVTPTSLWKRLKKEADSLEPAFFLCLCQKLQNMQIPFADDFGLLCLVELETDLHAIIALGNGSDGAEHLELAAQGCHDVHELGTVEGEGHLVADNGNVGFDRYTG